METLKKTFFLIAFIILLTQTVRHAYHSWIEPKDSVLDQFGESIEVEIKNAESLEELLIRYEEIERTKEELESDSTTQNISYYERFDKEPYKSEHLLKLAIKEWEMRSNEIYKIRIYSIFGLIFVILGLIIYKRFNYWLGLALIFTGFAEKIYWTSPSFFGDNTLEYSRLLVNKFYISLFAFVLLVVVGFVTKTVLLGNKRND